MSTKFSLVSAFVSNKWLWWFWVGQWWFQISNL